MLDEPAPAKINLALHVLGRRPDGYHLLDSAVAFAAAPEAADLVTLTPGGAGLTLAGPFAAPLAAEPPEANLCLRALAATGLAAGVRLEKRLPVAAGLGGGSADAAAVLRAARRSGGRLPAAPEALGADLPVCLAGRPARMTGVGEALAPLPPLPPAHLVLVNPGVPVSTAAVFARLARRENPPLPEPPARLADAAALAAWLAAARNDLEPAALALAPPIGAALAALAGTAALLARMSGSGATCFGLYPSAAAAQAAARRIAAAAPGWWVVPTALAP